MTWVKMLLSATLVVSSIGFGVGSSFFQQDVSGAGAAGQFLSGSWLYTVTATNPPGSPPLMSLCTFQTDLTSPGVRGTQVCSYTPILLPLPTGTLTVGPGQHGEWVLTGPRTFHFKSNLLVSDESGQFIGTWRNEGTQTLNETLDHITGSGVGGLFDPAGNPLMILESVFDAKPLEGVE